MKMRWLLFVSVFISIFFGAFGISSALSESQVTEINQTLAQSGSHVYGIARQATPMFYASDFPRYFGGGTGGTLILDDWNQIDPVETIVFPKSVFEIQKVVLYKTNILLQVTTSEYPYDGDPHYIDAQTVDIKINPPTPPRARSIHLPAPRAILAKMRAQLGKPYVWGGSIQGGVANLKKLYPPQGPTDKATAQKWILDGFDCSGILYWATNGYTPRNTSKLITFGSGLSIAGKTNQEIKSLLKPLDIIVWKGHNMIVIDQDHVIESAVNFTQTGNYSTPNGVRIVPTLEALDRIVNVFNRFPVNEYSDVVPEGKKAFVIRRWYPTK